jgi:hypothetical protein
MLILEGFYQSDFYRSWLKSWSVWRSAAAFGGQKLKKAETNRDIDVLEEERLNTVIQSAKYQQTLRLYHYKVVRHRSFAVGDLVLRRILMGEGRHKLSPLWEGPFIVSEVTRPGSYRLTQMDGTEVGNSWNIEHVRRFYP